MLLVEPLLLFHMRQLLSETPSVRFHQQIRPDHQPSWGRPRPRHYAAQHAMKEEEVQEVGLADTELIIQVIKCTFHNVHNMWQGLITDVLGCNSKLQTQDQYNILIWLWMNWRQYQELLGILRDIIAEPRQRRNLTAARVHRPPSHRRYQNLVWMKSVMSCNILNDLWWPFVS